MMRVSFLWLTYIWAVVVACGDWVEARVQRCVEEEHQQLWFVPTMDSDRT